MQLLHTKKEVLKPSVSSGVFCILFAAVGKKYAAGGKKHYVKKKPAGGKKPTKKQAGEDHPPVSHKLAQLNSLAMEISG